MQTLTKKTQTPHTPGPWQYDPATGDILDATGEVLIATVADNLDGKLDAKCHADGRLLAAAFDLYVACKALTILDRTPGGRITLGPAGLEQVRAAVLRAEGGK